MWVDVSVGMDVTVSVAVVTGRYRVEVDAGGRDGGLGLGAIALGVVAREASPWLHSAPPVGRAQYACIQRV